VGLLTSDFKCAGQDVRGMKPKSFIRGATGNSDVGFFCINYGARSMWFGRLREIGSEKEKGQELEEGSDGKENTRGNAPRNHNETRYEESPGKM